MNDRAVHVPSTRMRKNAIVTSPVSTPPPSPRAHKLIVNTLRLAAATGQSMALHFDPLAAFLTVASTTEPVLKVYAGSSGTHGTMEVRVSQPTHGPGILTRRVYMLRMPATFQCTWGLRTLVVNGCVILHGTWPHRAACASASIQLMGGARLHTTFPPGFAPRTMRVCARDGSVAALRLRQLPPVRPPVRQSGGDTVRERPMWIRHLQCTVWSNSHIMWLCHAPTFIHQVDIGSAGIQTSSVVAKGAPLQWDEGSPASEMSFHAPRHVREFVERFGGAPKWTGVK